MNPGISEDVSKVAQSIVEGMKAQPIALGLVVLNLVFLAVFYLLFSALNVRTTADLERSDAIIVKMLEKCK